MIGISADTANIAIIKKKHRDSQEEAATKTVQRIGF
jgi:hypothetical protein